MSSNEQRAAFEARDAYARVHGFDDWCDYCGGREPWMCEAEGIRAIAQALDAARDAALERGWRAAEDYFDCVHAGAALANFLDDVRANDEH